MKRSSEAGVAVDALDPTDPSDGPRTISGGTGRHTPDLRGLWRRALAFLVPVPMLAWPRPGRDAVSGRRRAPSVHRRRGRPSGRGSGRPVALGDLRADVAPATMAVAWTGRRRAPWLTLAAGVSLLVAFWAGLPDTDLAVATAATHGLDPTMVTAIDRAVTSHPAATVGLGLFLLGQTVGFVLLGISLWRARVVPHWLGIVLAASGPAHLLRAPLGNIGTGRGLGDDCTGYVGAAVALWRTDNADFDLADRPESACFEHHR